MRDQRIDDSHRIMRLVLDIADHAAAMSGADVWPQQNEEIGEAGHQRAEVRRSIVAVPYVAQHAAVAADHVIRSEHVGGLKSGRQDDRIGLHFLARCRDERVAAHFGEMLWDQPDVRFTQGAEPAIVEQHPLQERRIIGQQQRQQILPIAQLLLIVSGEELPVPVIDGVDRSRRIAPVGIAGQRAVDAVIEGPRQPLLDPVTVERERPHQIAHALGHRLAELREGGDPLFRAREDRHFGDLIGNRGRDLHTRRAIADHGNPFAGEIDIVAPR